MITPNLTLIFSTFFIRMQAIYRGKFVFNQLEHLRLCVGTNCASSLLVRLLEDSPNLRELDLFEMVSKLLGVFKRLILPAWSRLFPFILRKSDLVIARKSCLPAKKENDQWKIWNQ